MEISAISEFVTNFISSIVDILQKVGPFAGIFIVVLESMIPILPLGVFVAFNFSAYGVFLGFVLSYLATIPVSYTHLLFSCKHTLLSHCDMH